MTEDVVLSSTTLLGSWPGYFVLCHWRNNQREENTPITSMFVNICFSGRFKAWLEITCLSVRSQTQTKTAVSDY